MLSVRGRRPTEVLIEPIARGLLKARVSPNVVTVVGAAGATLVAVLLIPAGYLTLAAILSGLFAASDLIDGAMARLRDSGTRFGATLDATCDRITDGALFAAITYWLVDSYDAHGALVAASLTVLVCSQVTSYVKARGEANGFRMEGGLVERAERLIVGLVGLGLHGVGVPYAIDVALWLLAAGSVFTVVQRLRMAAKDPAAGEPSAPPAGASGAR